MFGVRRLTTSLPTRPSHPALTSLGDRQAAKSTTDERDWRTRSDPASLREVCEPAAL
jgi:hypothetical protein